MAAFPVGIAVIGCGMIANTYHLPALAKLEGVEWLYACDIIDERAQKAKEQYGFRHAVRDYREVLADKAVDAVFILTKIDCHAEIAIASARAKKAIFMQKAIGYSLAEARSIMDAVEQNGVQMTMSFMHRYFDESRAAAEMIRSGALGRLEHLRIRNATKNPEWTAPSYGGCMMDIGGHGIDLARSLTGREVLRVLAVHSAGQDGASPGGIPPHPRESPGTATGWSANLNGEEIRAILHYDMGEGLLVTHEIFWSQVAKTDRFDGEIYGHDGVLYLRNPFQEGNLYYGRRKGAGVEEGVEWEPVDYPDTFFGRFHHQLFLEDVASGSRNSLSCADGFAALAVIEAARRSIASGQWEGVYRPNGTRTEGKCP